MVWETLKKDPLFQRNENSLTTDDMKRRTALQYKQYCKYEFLPRDIENLPYKKKVSRF